MTYRRPTPPSPLNRFTRPGLPDDRPALPYERDVCMQLADDERCRVATVRARSCADADRIAAYLVRAIGTMAEPLLTARLREIAPAHPLLATLDRIAQELGYRCAGSTEQLFGAEEFGRALITAETLTDAHINTLLEDGTIPQYLADVARGERKPLPGHSAGKVRARLAEIYAYCYVDRTREIGAEDMERRDGQRAWLARIDEDLVEAGR